MDFDAKKITIREILSTGRKYFIPRYQREYSWGIKEIKDFYEDLIKSISIEAENLKSKEYFFGTIMLIGDMIQPKKELEIVDGQQRLTTFTIFLSALSDICYNVDENISNLIWKYVIGIDDNGDIYTVLKNETASPYFQSKIQKRLTSSENEKNVIEVKEYEKAGLTEEEKRIKNAYEFFYENLQEEKIKKYLKIGQEIPYIKIIKIIRDQLLESQIIYICSIDRDSVNKIFENINARGKQLSSIDLIKNEIFSVENETVPKDDAKEIWEGIKVNLCKDNQFISMDTFIRHFWIAKYGPTTEKELYSNFLKKIKEKDYFKFIKELKETSEYYHNIMVPEVKLFLKSNRGNGINEWDAEQLVHYLQNLNDNFKISQVRIILLVLYEAYIKNKIKYREFKSTIKFLEEFHYIYNGVCKKPTNILENKYGSFARKIINTEDKKEINNYIKSLKEELKSLKPDKEMFVSKFKELIYSKEMENKEINQKNLVTKYSIRKYEEFLCNKGYYDIKRSSIEHILPEKSSVKNKLNIGNLVLLEDDLNNRANNLSFKEKVEIYKESNYKSVQEIIENFKKDFTEFDIEGRATKMSNFIYEQILK